MRGIRLFCVLSTLGAALIAHGCYESAVVTDGDVDIDVDVDSDSDGDTDSDGDEPYRMRCDWPCQPAELPDISPLRFTSLRISSPPALASPLIQAIIDYGMDGFDMMLLMEVDWDGELTRLGPGVASSRPPTNDRQLCNLSWDRALPPSEAPLTASGYGIRAGYFDQVEIVLYAEGSSEMVMTLPLRHIELEAIISHDLACIGAPNLDPWSSEPYAYSQNWETAGLLGGWLSFDDTSRVFIEDLGVTLCTMLCSAECYDVDPMDCPNPTEPIPGAGQRGWFFTADFGAAPATISEP